MNQKEKLTEATMLALQGKLTEAESNSHFEVVYNDGAIQRERTENETYEFDGTEEDLMEFLDEIYTDCTKGEDDELVTFNEWKEIYESEADYSGSTFIVSIEKDGKLIFKNNDELDDEAEDEADEDEENNDLDTKNNNNAELSKDMKNFISKLKTLKDNEKPYESARTVAEEKEYIANLIKGNLMVNFNPLAQDYKEGAVETFERRQLGNTDDENFNDVYLKFVYEKNKEMYKEYIYKIADALKAIYDTKFQSDTK